MHSSSAIRLRQGPQTVVILVALAAVWPAAAAADGQKEGSIRADTASATSRTPDSEADPDSKRGPSPPLTAQETIFERVTVVGDADDARRLPGSAHVVGKEELEKQCYGDLHRILRQVPGINIQEEDGYGLRPNIGMRGTGVERSSKITLLEDGVLIAPAPYTAPAAYYVPTAARMESVEVRKGSSSIRQGPNTNGGALNLVSSAVPGSFSVAADIAGGTNGTRRLHGLVGDSGERFGWMIEAFSFHTDGFKRLDTGADTGFDLADILGKFRFNSSAHATLQQSVELKLGKTIQDGSETYLGLTEIDFGERPFRRYAASELDNIDTDHEQIQLRYFLRPAANLDLTTTVYDNGFYRDWFKNESIRGTSNRAVLEDPETFATEVAILRGELDSNPGDLALRHNRRNYSSRGLETILGWTPKGHESHHQLELGIRYHEDEEDRFQEEDLFQMLDGSLALSETGPPGSQSNRVSSGDALAVFVSDRVQLGQWTLIPGLRYESIRYTRLDFSTADPTRSEGPTRTRQNSVDVAIPGLGVTRELGPHDQLFLGIHRGFSPPGAGVNEDTREEESLNYEVGYRHHSGRLAFEVVGFLNDYENLLGVETVSGGGGSAGDLFNGGAVEVEGLESSFNYELYGGARLSLPLQLTYTYTTARFLTSFKTSFADWAPLVETGDYVPYIPEQQLYLSLSALGNAWGVHLNSNYQDEMRTNAGQGAIPEGEGTEARVVVDLAAEYELRQRLSLYVQVRNVTNEVFIVSRRPYGVRPGIDRTVVLGASFDL